MLKKACLLLCSFLCSVGIFGLLATLTVHHLATPASTKSWLQKSGAYQTLPDALRNQASIADETSDYTNEAVAQATRSALTPTFLQTSSEQIIDATYAWLEGKTTTPNFSVDLAPIKQAFADNLAISLKNRYEALPVCGVAQLPTSTNPFTIDCRPSIGVDIDRVIAIEKEKLLQNEALLPSEPLTAQNLALFGQTGTTKLFTSSRAPQIYQAVMLASIGFAIVVFLSSLGLIFVSPSRKHGLRKVAVRLTIMSLLFLVLADLSALGLTKIRNLATTQDKTAAISAYKDIFSQGINAVRSDVIITSGIIGGSALVLGIVLLVLTRKAKSANEEVVIETTPPKTSQKMPPQKPKKISPKKPTPTVASPAPKQQVAPLLKPRQQQAPAVIKPTKPLGGNGNLIQ